MKITWFFSSQVHHDERSDEESQAPPCKQSNAKHRVSFDPSRQEQFSWLVYVPEDDGEGPSIYCSLCQKHISTISTPWVNTPCRLCQESDDGHGWRCFLFHDLSYTIPSCQYCPCTTSFNCWLRERVLDAKMNKDWCKKQVEVRHSRQAYSTIIWGAKCGRV